MTRAVVGPLEEEAVEEEEEEEGGVCLEAAKSTRGLTCKWSIWERSICGKQKCKFIR